MFGFRVEVGDGFRVCVGATCLNETVEAVRNGLTILEDRLDPFPPDDRGR